MYLEGRGVSRDDEAAVTWIRQAADGGNAYAQNTLGWLYENGRGVRLDRLGPEAQPPAGFVVARPMGRMFRVLGRVPP